MKIMPTSPDVSLESIEKKAAHEIALFGGELAKTEISPVAFGLKALILHFIMDEKKGSTDKLESDISKIEGVNGVEIIDVRRAVG